MDNPFIAAAGMVAFTAVVAAALMGWACLSVLIAEKFKWPMWTSLLINVMPVLIGLYFYLALVRL